LLDQNRRNYDAGGSVLTIEGSNSPLAKHEQQRIQNNYDYNHVLKQGQSLPKSRQMRTIEDQHDLRQSYQKELANSKFLKNREVNLFSNGKVRYSERTRRTKP
jgi:hypothetical protein